MNKAKIIALIQIQNEPIKIAQLIKEGSNTIVKLQGGF